MNKTISVNINGLIFNIEEAAYERLKNYLDTIRKYLKNDVGSDEVITDIESRIGELFMEDINDRKEVINIEDVDRVISIMGQPEEYVDEGFEESSQQRSSRKGKKKRLFRDKDNSLIGGVCSGISNYFGWDPVWLRILAVVLFIFAGFGLLTYIILWVVIPKAETTAEKIQMYGEPVTVENIKKVVDDGIDSLVGNADSHSSQGARKEKVRSGLKSFFDAIISIFKALFKFVGKIFGAGLLFIGLIVLICLLFFLVDPAAIDFQRSSIGDAISFGDIKDLYIGDSSQGGLLTLGILMAVVAPLTALIYAGLKLIFKIRTNSKALGWVLVMVFIVGVSLAATSALRLTKEHTRHEIVQDISRVEVEAETIILESSEKKDNYRHHDGGSFLRFDNDVVKMERVEFTVLQSAYDTIPQVEVIRSCDGRNESEAKKRISGISYDWNVKGEKMIFDPFITINKKDLFRNQKVEVILRLPVGHKIFFDRSMRNIMYNIPNVKGIWDNDMVEETWLMSEDGLLCVSCEEEAI
ncbi:MAG: PspC domain-containing protein [Flavobacteriales bacterium]|nr:PspC domain-containing protein [Flavobacteriales bacterium]